jgi:hypothetical protein
MDKENEHLAEGKLAGGTKVLAEADQQRKCVC